MLSVGYHHWSSPRFCCQQRHPCPSQPLNHSSYRIPISIQFIWALILSGGMLFLPEVSPHFPYFHLLLTLWNLDCWCHNTCPPMVYWCAHSLSTYYASHDPQSWPHGMRRLRNKIPPSHSTSWYFRAVIFLWCSYPSAAHVFSWKESTLCTSYANISGILYIVKHSRAGLLERYSSTL